MTVDLIKLFDFPVTLNTHKNTRGGTVVADRPIALHIRRRFFNPTETFLYNLISGLSTWEPILGSAESVNRDLFPLPEVRSIATSLPENALNLGLTRISRRLSVFGGFAYAIYKVRPAIVHAHFGYDAAKVVNACKLLRTPLIASFYGIDTAPPGSKIGRSLGIGFPELFRYASAVVVEGPHARDRVSTDWGCPDDKLRIVRISIPVQAIQFQPRDASSTRPIRILHCGRMVEKKGLIQLLLALGELKKRGRGFELRIIGDGELRGDAEALVSTLDLRNNVHFMGSRSREEFWQELYSSDLVAAPSLTSPDGDTEGGAPTVILEAQAAGVPVVASDHADIPNVVVAGKSAWLAVAGEVGSLVATFEQAMEARAQWAQVGAEGRRFVAENHDIPVVCAEMERVYDEVSGRGSAEGE